MCRPYIAPPVTLAGPGSGERDSSLPLASKVSEPPRYESLSPEWRVTSMRAEASPGLLTLMIQGRPPPQALEASSSTMGRGASGVATPLRSTSSARGNTALK